ncbi:TPA: oligosaccharide flippase family protein [Vibrio vulnificus]|nr:oligosaccharide flippase family protein [Vibrio vulnificus]HAT8526047.1 oligosaccharide flippase family protein [Vibrio vulnificus]HDY7648748.1 oligosaccharide flippase family protein [Vibrio vulnificus]
MSRKLNGAILNSVSGRLLTYFVQFGSLAIYARLFTPEEFGVIASIQVFVIFFQMLADVGIGPAIINEDKFSDSQRDGVFSVTAILGCFLALLFFLFSYALNYFYGGYEYQKIAVFVCVSIFFSSLNVVPMTAMNKDAKFIHIAFVDIVAECLSLSVVYLLYVQNYGIIALAARPMVQSISRFIGVWVISNETDLGRPMLGKELHHIKVILGFSLYQFGFNFINYFSRNLDNILIAKYFGMASIGIYEKSYQLMRYPLMITTFAMTPAIQPILTKVRNDKEKVIYEHNRLTSRLLAISLPISAFIYLNSQNIIMMLFGAQWLEIVPLIKIFSFMIPIQAVLSTSGSFFQVMNKPRFLFISGVISAVVNVTVIISGIILGDIKYVAMALVVGFSINFFQAYLILFRYCFVSSAKGFYLGQIKVLSTMLMPVVVYFLIRSFILINIDCSTFVELLVNGLVGLISLLIFFFPIKRVIA